MRQRERRPAPCSTVQQHDSLGLFTGQPEPARYRSQVVDALRDTERPCCFLHFVLLGTLQTFTRKRVWHNANVSAPESIGLEAGTVVIPSSVSSAGSTGRVKPPSNSSSDSDATDTASSLATEAPLPTPNLISLSNECGDRERPGDGPGALSSLIGEESGELRRFRLNGLVRPLTMKLFTIRSRFCGTGNSR